MTPRIHRESGNVFFYIFLGIALFGALSFAVSQGSRGSVKNLSDEQLRLRSTEILDYADSVAKAVATVRLRGTPTAQISFANGVDNAYGTPGTAPLNEVFNSEGGGMIYRQPPQEIIDTPGTKYAFTWNTAVAGIGKTCADATCPELLLTLSHLKKDMCVALNDLSDVDNPSDDPPADTAITLGTPFTGTIGYTEIVGDETGSAPVNGKTTGCFKNDTSGLYVFYKILWTQ